MEVKFIGSIKGANVWFAMVNPLRQFQSYEVLCAVEVEAKRRYLVNLVRGLMRWRWVAFPRFSVVSVWDSNRLVMLAPLRLEKGQCYIAGDSCNMDYTDVIWNVKDREIKISALKMLLSSLHNLGYHRIVFNQLEVAGVTNGILSDFDPQIIRESKSVKIILEEGDYEKYFSRLCKHAKQNIRTAYNRLRRDGHIYSLSVYSRAGIGENLLSDTSLGILHKCHKLYCQRQDIRYGNGSGLKSHIAKIWGNYTSIASLSDNSFLAVLNIDGRVAAFMEGYVNSEVGGIELPRLAIDDVYRWYSPGLLLISEVAKYFFAETKLRVIDLCRGTEKYKYDMGGREYATRTIVIDTKDKWMK